MTNNNQDANIIAQEKEIIEEAYAATMEPERLSAFEAYWEAYIDAGLAKTNGNPQDLRNTPVDAHIDRALEIIERMGAAQTVEKNAQIIVDSNYGVGFLINKVGKIIASNADALERTRHADTLKDIGLDGDSYQLIVEWVHQDTRSRRFMFAHVHFEGSQTKTCLFVTPVDLPSVNPNTTETCFLVTTVDFDISAEALEAIRDTYQLTNAEADVAMHLANGQSPADITILRKASINTVRTQIKKILSKTDTRNISDLIRTLSRMSEKFSAVESQLSRTEMHQADKAYARPGHMTLPDGRYLSYIEQGHPNGEPVIHIHSAVSGAHITPESAQYAVLKGLRIISPYRPGYGDSDHNFKPDIQATCDAFADDLKAVLDQLGIKKAVIVGKPYAQRFAVKYPEHTRALCCLNYVPLWNDEQLEHMNRRYRTMIKTSMYSPRIVKYPARLAKILIDTGRGDLFVKGLNKRSNGDGKKAKSSGRVDHIIYNLQELYKQGVEAFARDVPSIHTDWSDDAKKLTVPVILIYSDPNPYQPKYVFERYKELVPQAKMVEMDQSSKQRGFKAVIDQINMLEV